MEGEFSCSWRDGESLQAQASRVEIRPGRSVQLVCLPPTSPGAQTLLFVHGSAGSMTQFLPVASALSSAKGFGVVAYDWLGCGQSDKPRDWAAYSFEEMFEDLLAVWKQFCASRARAPNRCVVVAHSFGVHLALRLALRLRDADESPAGLALLAGPLRVPEGAHPVFRLPLFMLRALQGTLTKGFLGMAFAPGADQELIANQEAGCNANDMFMCKAYYRQVRCMPKEELASLPHLRTPALVVRGEHDGIISHEVSQELAEGVPGAGAKVVSVPGASHNLMLEQPSSVARLLAEFVSDWCGAAQ